MSASPPASDDPIELKKRARRRLIGAIVFASVAAVVLPMVMDKEPPPPLPGIDLRIPSQDKGFVPPPVRPAVPTVAEPVVPPTAVEAARPVPSEPSRPAGTANSAVPSARPDPAPVATKTDQATAKPLPPARPAPPESNRDKDARRVQAILDGKPAPASGQYAVLIGAFADPANVANLKKKIGELGLPVYTEPLDSPQGRKTRVRAGPFASREAADKAAQRLKSIGVGGIVAAKQ